MHRHHTKSIKHIDFGDRSLVSPLITILVAQIKADLAKVKFVLAKVKADLAKVKIVLAKIKIDLAKVKIDLAKIKLCATGSC